MKTYLGDSVYVDDEHGMVKLTTENGLGASNTIFLEPEVLGALFTWLVANEIVTTEETHA